MGIRNPRLLDVLGVELDAASTDFAIPRLQGDIPLCVDPFLLWASQDPRRRALHDELLGFFRYVAECMRDGRTDDAAKLLAHCEEPQSLGLGYSASSRKGNNIGAKLIAALLNAHKLIPQLRDGNIQHFEELQLVVPHFAEDRTSDTACAILKRFFIEYTVEQCAALKIPVRKASVGFLYDTEQKLWRPADAVELPYNPVDSRPILFAPLNMLRRLPWINYDDYYDSAYATRILGADARGRVAKEAVLKFNARNYTEIERYVRDKEKQAARCHPDPLFTPLASPSIASKIKQIRALPSGTTGGADRKYEELVCAVLKSALYPALELADDQVRTVSGAHIRDLIFYNDAKTEFWREVRAEYGAKQPVFELKNVYSLESEHVNQLYRYLDADFGRFGVLVARNPPPRSVIQNLVDLHSSKRVVILTLHDGDLDLIRAMLESGRDPCEVVKKKYVEFLRQLPK